MNDVWVSGRGRCLSAFCYVLYKKWNPLFCHEKSDSADLVDSYHGNTIRIVCEGMEQVPCLELLHEKKQRAKVTFRCYCS